MEAGPEAEFSEFVHSRWPRLVRLAYGITGDRALAEDLAQTALANAYALDRFTPGPVPFHAVVRAEGGIAVAVVHGDRDAGEAGAPGADIGTCRPATWPARGQ